MFLQIHEITAADVRHLHCTDPALRAEVDAVNRSIHRLDESVSDLDTPKLQSTGKPIGMEVTAWPVL